MKIDILNKDNKVKGSVELNPEVFEAQASVPLMHQVVRMQLATRRAGTVNTKTRTDVSGGGKKPWRQKGTGRARCGSNRSPVWVGGGTVFGPHPRSYAFEVPKKMRKSALKGALSVKAGESKLVVVDKVEFTEPKTKLMVEFLTNLGVINQKVLVIDTAKNVNLIKSLNNIPGVDFLPVDGLNLYDLLWHDKLVVTAAAIDKIVERLG